MCAFIDIIQQNWVLGQVEVSPFLRAKYECLFTTFLEDIYFIDIQINFGSKNNDQPFISVKRTKQKYI